MGALVGIVAATGTAVVGQATGGLGSMAILGGGKLLKVSQRGVTWTIHYSKRGGQRTKVGCEGGIHAGMGLAATCGVDGMATLGGSRMSTLG